MSQSGPFAPAYDTGEIETLTFDFGPTLAAGDSITSVQTMTCVVVQGAKDAASATRLLNGPAIVASPSTGQPGQAVVQQVSGMLGERTYQIGCLANISDGRRSSLRADMPCLTRPT